MPARFLVKSDLFGATAGVGKFENVALAAGLTTRGPNMAGSSIFDDFNGDNLPDVVTSALDADLGASISINKGDGTFEDRSAKAGLTDQTYALNVTRADYDNDGDLDLLFLRGGWDSPMRLSLMRNKGDATFEDVTVAPGLGLPIATESAAWADYDNDGDLDLFVELGGAAPGDTAYNILFRNPGQGGRHYLKVKLNGVKSNRSAVGAKMVANYTTKSGDPRQVHRTVGNNSSFGGNTLVETIGLLDADVVTSLEITWPAGRVKQIFRDLPADRFIEITEGQETLKTVGKAR